MLIILIILALLGYGGYRLYLHLQEPEVTNELTLYGNVDLREVNLAFKDSERIEAVLVEEGDVVEKGQVLARLETERLEENIAATRANAEAQRFVVTRLENGTRTQEIESARADVERFEAELEIAQQTLDRQVRLLRRDAVAQQDVDDARARRDVAQARVRAAKKQLDLLLAGPRWEDINEARARLDALHAQLMLLQTQLEEYTLRSPRNGVVRNRLLEPGDIASPQRPVFSVAIMDPKWIRTYVSETNLGRIHPGMTGNATIDTYPDTTYPGWIGFISPMAEFTPRSVETPELRTDLVYEVRFFVRDPDNDLRLGMPATVHLSLAGNGTTPASYMAPVDRPGSNATEKAE
ncbi:MAG: efflux RND transporter periplasmic adaptor subunit [Oceanidesulfovibrio sp.]